MSKSHFDTWPTERLIDKFIDVLIKQEKAASEDKTNIYNKYFIIMGKIVDELKSRPGDERRLLIPLLTHPSYAVRYFSAFSTLTIAPQQAVTTLEILAASLQYPYAYNAIGTLNSLKSGFLIPS